MISVEGHNCKHSNDHNKGRPWLQAPHTSKRKLLSSSKTPIQGVESQRYPRQGRWSKKILIVILKPVLTTFFSFRAQMESSGVRLRSMKDCFDKFHTTFNKIFYCSLNQYCFKTGVVYFDQWMHIMYKRCSIKAHLVMWGKMNIFSIQEWVPKTGWQPELHPTQHRPDTLCIGQGPPRQGNNPYRALQYR